MFFYLTLSVAVLRLWKHWLGWAQESTVDTTSDCESHLWRLTYHKWSKASRYENKRKQPASTAVSVLAQKSPEKRTKKKSAWSGIKQKHFTCWTFKLVELTSWTASTFSPFLPSQIDQRLCCNSDSASFEVHIWRAVTSQRCIEYFPNSPKVQGYSKCALQMHTTIGQFEVCIAITLTTVVNFSIPECFTAAFSLFVYLAVCSQSVVKKKLVKTFSCF